MTKIWDPHFLRYAGAEPPKQMFKEQRQAHQALNESLEAKYRATRQAKPIETDRPSSIMADMKKPAPQPDVPESDSGRVVEEKA